MPPAARVTDMHTCPMVTGVVPHVGGPIIPPGCPTVLIGMLPAARIGDMVTCVGPPDTIVKGSPTVLIGNMPAARMGDNTAHGGVIVAGHPTTMIGDAGSGGGGGGGGAGGGGTGGGGDDPESGTGLRAEAETEGEDAPGRTVTISSVVYGVSPRQASECSNPQCQPTFREAAEDGSPLIERAAAESAEQRATPPRSDERQDEDENEDGSEPGTPGWPGQPALPS